LLPGFGKIEGRHRQTVEKKPQWIPASEAVEKVVDTLKRLFVWDCFVAALLATTYNCVLKVTKVRHCEHA
jgi:hypothetical protein